MRVIRAAACAWLLSLAACGGNADLPANEGAIGQTNSGKPQTAGANSVTPAPVGKDCANFGPQDQIVAGVFKWGVPLEEAIRRLKCAGFDVADMPAPDTRMLSGRQINQIGAVLKSVRVELTYTGLPGKEQVIRARQIVNLREDEAAPMSTVMANLEKSYGTFVTAPQQPTDRHAGMIARDVDAVAVGGDSAWPQPCFDARMRSPDGVQACGETIVYEINTYPNSDAVRRFVLTVDNYRATGKAVADASRAIVQLQQQQEQERNAAVGADGLTAEASEFGKLCSINPYQNKLFKCECLAREFQRWRSKRGPDVPGSEISQIVTNSAEVNPACANTEVMRQGTTNSCLGFVAGYAAAPSDMKTEKAQYCSCVGNKLAKEFGAYPRLSSQWVETLRSNAMTECRKPAIRAQVNAGR